MAAGKPCLGVAEGGLVETISHEKDGYLIPANPTKNDIKKGVQYLTPERCLEMKDACVEKAHEFREDVFVERMEEVIYASKPVQ